MCKLQDENIIHLPVGFEIIFPSLMEMARLLDLDVFKDQDSHALQDIYAKRNLKLTRIPEEMMHRVPTTLLHSLEGMSTDQLDWENLLKLQSKDGSFLVSPACTAFAYMQTKNNKCLQYIQKVVQQFEGGGQSSEGVTVMCNLYRASQVSFPGETILQEAKQFSSKFLREKQASNQLLDKWLITKDLPAEIGYTLDVPWYASLRRIEARFHIEQYGGENDAWIGKTLYRMPNVSNNTNLELAKLDFNKCQEQHQLEWLDVQKWYTECNLEIMVDKKELLQAYFLAAACTFEPERSRVRLAWTKSAVLIKAVSLYFEDISSEQQRAFIQEFINNMEARRKTKKKAPSEILGDVLIQALVLTLNDISLSVLLDHGRDIHHQLRGSWEKFLLSNNKEERQHYEAYLLVEMMMFCSIHLPELGDTILLHAKYNRLSSLTNSISHQLVRQRTQSYHLTSHSKSVKGHEKGNNGVFTDEDADLDIIESDMQELVKCALQRSDSVIDHEIKQTFLMVVKSYFYVTHCLPETIDFHIGKVLFERVL
ncbi:hypothetical protein MKX01_010518 [Papaver californicum]|nr:hypothetical protein MKX01_010518 [Papaver californicum]